MWQYLFKHRLSSWMVVRARSRTSTFFYTLVSLKRCEISKRPIIEDKNSSNLCFLSFKVIFELHNSHFPYLPALSSLNTRWQLELPFRARPRHRPTGSCHTKKISMATPGVQHPRSGQRHRPVESHDSLQRFSPDKGMSQSQPISNAAWSTNLQCQK